MSTPSEWRLAGGTWYPISEELNRTQIGDAYKFYTHRSKPTRCDSCDKTIRNESMIRVIVDTSEGTILNYHTNHLPEEYKNKIEFR